MTRHELTVAMMTLNSMPIERWGLSPMSTTTLDHMDALTVADAYYVVLATVLGAPLLTCDAALSRSHGHDAVIELVG